MHKQASSQIEVSRLRLLRLQAHQLEVAETPLHQALRLGNQLARRFPSSLALRDCLQERQVVPPDMYQVAVLQVHRALISIPIPLLLLQIMHPRLLVPVPDKAHLMGTTVESRWEHRVALSSLWRTIHPSKAVYSDLRSSLPTIRERDR